MIDIAWIDNGLTTGFFTEGLVRTIINDREQQNIIRGIHCFHSSNISDGRNECVEKFLSSKSEYLLFIDSDIVFDVDKIYKMYNLMQSNNILVASALYGFANNTLSAFEAAPNGAEYGYRQMSYEELEGKEIVKVDAVGAGALMVHRDVYEDSYERISTSRKWFYESMGKTGIQGEDFSFCRRIKDHGFDIYIFPNIRVPHFKLVAF